MLGAGSPPHFHVKLSSCLAETRPATFGGGLPEEGAARRYAPLSMRQNASIVASLHRRSGTVWPYMM